MDGSHLGLDHSRQQDLAAQLRRQIAQVTSEKEDAKLNLEALKRTVDSHLLRLNSILGSSDVNFDRLCGSIQAFDADLKGRLESEEVSVQDGLPTEGTYEVLRSSLSDAQKRCQALNGDMLRVADANEELMSTLKTLKGTNKRLVEEVQKQTEELSNLTQQRLLDMENLSRLEEAFRHEKVMWQQEAHRSIEAEQQQCDDEFRKMKDHLTAQLEGCIRHARVVASKTGALKTMQGQLKSEVQGFKASTSATMKKVEKDVLDKISLHARQMHAEQSKLKDIEHNLQVKLRAEREVRENDTATWRNRHAAMTAELEELAAKRDREVLELQAKVEAVSSTREAEAAAVQSDRTVLHEQVEANVKEVALLEAMIQTARRKVLQLESRLAQAEGERDRLQLSADTLRQQIRESDEALGEAVRSNEALREQMEVQRLDAQSANERDLKLCREMFERRLELAAQSHEAEQGDLAKRTRTLEESIGVKAGELQAAKELLAQRSRMRDSLQRDVLMWKAQHELASKMKTDVERELEQFKQEYMGGELQRRQEEHDELQLRKADLEQHRAAIADEAQQVEQAVKSRELADREQIQAIRELHREQIMELDRTKKGLMEVENRLAVAKAEAATTTQQLSERRDGLEQDLSRLNSELGAEKREYERRIQAERMNCESMRESVEKLRTDHRNSYRAAFEGPVQQISALEGAISDIQRSSDAELTGLRQKSEKLRIRIDELESELSRAQAKLEQTEREVQEGTSRLNLAKVNHRSTREGLERERNMKNEELQRVQRAITQKTDQLKSLTRAGEDVRKRMLRDIEEAKATKAKQLAEADHRLHSLRSEYSMAIEDKEADYRSSRLDGLFEPGATSGVHRSLASMEDRVADLRRGIGGV
eukprot:TRINITY_DN123722_c0_g1_i1.p1 TRINITY_DN123722_c0_g1~~TRINITY_DN123722_c0_g1_i1.p1  ORF type:complete len:882 (+),score=310.46 TRINITY_DN123722_c0_g1_i1:118-2763(+)